MRKRGETTKKKWKGLNHLRQLLDKIPSRSHEDIACHRQRIEVLRAQCAHTIKWVDDGGGNKLDCWAYALGIPSDIPNATDPNILEEFFNSEVLKLLKVVPNSLNGKMRICKEIRHYFRLESSKKQKGIKRSAKSGSYR